MARRWEYWPKSLKMASETALPLLSSRTKYLNQAFMKIHRDSFGSLHYLPCMQLDSIEARKADCLKWETDIHGLARPLVDSSSARSHLSFSALSSAINPPTSRL